MLPTGSLDQKFSTLKIGETMKLSKTLAIIPATLFALTASGLAQADGAALYQAKTCWSCHGKDAKTPIMPTYPKLAGQNADYLYNQMHDIKSGKRNNGQAAVMRGVMGMVNDAEMREIANWISTQ